MKALAIKLLLLVNFTYWATGLALSLHERFEHEHEQEPAAVVADANSLAPAKGDSSTPPLHPPDDHSDCPTCQMLKLMKAQPSAPPTLPPVVEPFVETLPVLPLQARSLSFILFLPARAPPVQSLPLSV